MQELGQEVQKYIAENEDKIIRALENYYRNFLTEQEKEFVGWCNLENVYPNRVADYIKANDLGNPNNREDALEYLRKVNALECVLVTEEIVRDEVKALPDEELEKAYEEVIIGAKFYIGSFGGVARIKDCDLTDAELVHYAAYSYAFATYNFTKELFRKGKPETLKVKKDSRHSEQVPVENIFADAVRRIAICEEYARKIDQE
jgi:hypothetical protein